MLLKLETRVQFNLYLVSFFSMAEIISILCFPFELFFSVWSRAICNLFLFKVTIRNLYYSQCKHYVFLSWLRKRTWQLLRLSLRSPNICWFYNLFKWLLTFGTCCFSDCHKDTNATQALSVRKWFRRAFLHFEHWQTTNAHSRRS